MLQGVAASPGGLAGVETSGMTEHLRRPELHADDFAVSLFIRRRDKRYRGRGAGGGGGRAPLTAGHAPPVHLITAGCSREEVCSYRPVIKLHLMITWTFVTCLSVNLDKKHFLYLLLNKTV